MGNLFAYELKYYFNNLKELIYLYSYFISMILLIPFAGSYDAARLQSLGVIALWIGLASAVTIAANTLFQRDYVQGRLAYYQLLPTALVLLVLAKWAAFFVFVSIPLLGVLPLAALLYHFTATQMLHCAVGLMAGAGALTILSTLVAGLTSGLEKAGAVFSLIILPLSIPILIFGAQYCLDSTMLWQKNLWFLLGFSFFMLPIMCFAGAFGIRASN